LSFKPWYRIEESSSADDNADIENYMGNYENRAYQQWNGHLFSAMLRNIFDSENHYNSELQWSFPIKSRLRGLVQRRYGFTGKGSTESKATRFAPTCLYGSKVPM
jgi:phospholipase A1